MSHLALDTNAVSALFDGDEALTAVLVGVERFTIPVVVLGEYRYGLLRSRHRRKLEALLDSLARESDLADVDDETTRFYAVVREALRAKGRPLPENDVWIAAICLQHELELVTRDGDFAHVEGLRVTSW